MKKFNEIFREYIGYILTLLVVLAYILTAIFNLSQTGNDLIEILASSFLIFILGIALSNTLGHQGMNDGEQNQDVKEVKQTHYETLVATQTYWHDTPKYCEFKNAQALQQERERILNFATLKYKDYYDKDARFIGTFIDEPKDERFKSTVKKQNKAIKKSIDLIITQITPSDMITESSKPNDPLARGRSKSKYLVQQNTRDIFSKVATGIFGGIYTATFIGADVGTIAYRIVIAIVLLAFAVVRYYSNFRYVVSEYKERIEMSTHWLKEFKTMCDQDFFKKR
jgi:hypothetical protein